MTHDSLDLLVDKFPGDSRAEQVDRAIRSLTRATREAQIAACELVWELHAEGLWRLLRRSDGAAYASSFAYFQEVFGTAKVSTFYSRLRIGKAIRSVPPGSRNWLRDQLAGLPLARSTVIAAAILHSRSIEEIATWVDRAARLGTPRLLDQIRTTLGDTPRRWPPCPTCGRPMRKAVGAPRIDEDRRGEPVGAGAARSPGGAPARRSTRDAGGRSIPPRAVAEGRA